ncbi:MAG: RHS repeat domain-containing protein [Candidatus Kapaibacterium sp.]
MPFLSLLPNGDKRYRIQDNLGSTRVVLTADGSTYDWNEYEPFGTILRSGGGQLSSDRLSYIGKEKDSESDLGDFGVRKYEAETGRFLSVDPLWEEQRPWNVYHYSANNPIVLKDPDGKCPNCLTAAIGAGIGALIGGGVEIASQLYNNGSVNNWSAVGGSALQGGITGGAAGFTGGASLAATAAVAGGANAVGGALNRATQGQGTTLPNIVTDATVGAVLGAGGKLVGNAVSSGTNNLSKSAKGKLGEAITEIKYAAQGYKNSGKAIVETGGKTATGKAAVAKYDFDMTNIITGKRITVESKFNGSTLTPNQAAAQSRVTTQGGLIIDRTTSQGLGNGAKAATVGAGSGVDAQRNRKR